MLSHQVLVATLFVGNLMGSVFDGPTQQSWATESEEPGYEVPRRTCGYFFLQSILEDILIRRRSSQNSRNKTGTVSG